MNPQLFAVAHCSLSLFKVPHAAGGAWHRLTSRELGREWPDGENRTNTLVFIGKHLDRAALTEGFKACLA